MNKDKEELKDNFCCEKKDDSMLPFLSLLLTTFSVGKPSSFTEMELATLKGKVEVLEKIVLGKVE